MRRREVWVTLFIFGKRGRIFLPDDLDKLILLMESLTRVNVKVRLVPSKGYPDCGVLQARVPRGAK